MQNVITVATMRDSDAHTIAEYTPSRELMHRAALGVYQAADWTGKTVAILTGGGNNGGSGENRTAPSNTPVPAPSTKTPQMNDDMKSLNELFAGIQAGTTPITGITVKTSYSNPNGNPLEFDAANIPAEQQELYNKIIDFIKGIKISFSACNWDKFLNVIGAAPERKTNEAALTTTMVEKGSDSVIYIKTESQTLALTFINDGTILLAGCTFDAGAAEGKITPSATLICGSFDMNYTMQLRSLFGVK